METYLVFSDSYEEYVDTLKKLENLNYYWRNGQKPTYYKKYWEESTGGVVICLVPKTKKMTWEDFSKYTDYYTNYVTVNIDELKYINLS